MYSYVDDFCYLEWLSRFTGATVYGCLDTRTYPPGSAIVWWPAGLISTVFFGATIKVDFLRIAPIFVAFLSFFYWIGSLFLLIRFIDRNFSKILKTQLKIIGWSVLFLFCVPILYYGTHRTTLLHTPELFFILLMFDAMQLKRLWLVCACAAMAALLRMNDFPALLFPLYLLLNQRHGVFSKLWMRIGTVTILALPLLYILWTAFGDGYHHKLNAWHLLQQFSFIRVLHVFIGADWGLIWTAPAWLMAWGAGLWRWRSLSAIARLCIVWMTISLFICICWKGNGSDFGYRYLIGSYPGALWIFMEILLQMAPTLQRRWMQICASVLTINAVWLFWLTWIYKEFPDVTPYGIRHWGGRHPELLINSVRHLFDSQSYIQPLYHSPVAALYFTASDHASRYAVPRGFWGLPSFPLLVATILASLALLGSVLYLIHRFRRTP